MKKHISIIAAALLLAECTTQENPVKVTQDSYNRMLTLKPHMYKYNPKKDESNKVITIIVITNHLFLKPQIKSIEKVMIKYIITAPVSGSIKVNAEGIKTITSTFKRNFNSSVSSGLEYSSLKSLIILERVMIKKTFINSEG